MRTTSHLAPEPDGGRLLRKVHRRASRYRVRRASVWLIAPTVTLLVVVGHMSTESHQALIDEQSHRTATVVSAERPPLAGRSRSPEVTVQIDGREVVLSLPFPEEDDVEPGDPIEVVVDPDDPEYAIAVSSHEDWAYSWWGGLLVDILVGGAIAGFWLWRALAVPARSALASARSARSVRPVELVGVDGDHLALRDADMRTWTWTAGEPWNGPTRMSLQVLGELGDGEWPVVAVRRRLHWPGAPVRPAS